MSQGTGAQGGNGGAASGAAEPTLPVATTTGMNGGGGATGRTASVRWVVLFTGRKATEDYQPSSSDGENPALVREVTNICLALHPHSEIRLFPHGGEALLFYRAQTTGEIVLTRVTTAPNPDGVRTALEYCSLVLSAPQFQSLLGGDPFFAVRSTDLFDLVRTRFLSGARTPIAASVPTGQAAKPDATTLSPGGPAFAGGAPGEEPLSTTENVAALEAYCAAAAASSAPIPTFATWWSSSGVVPPGVFEIVLRAAAARAPTLREASDQLTEFAADLKGALPKTSADDLVSSDLTRTILASIGTAQQAVSRAGAHINTETPAQFQTQLTEAALQCENIARDITALVARQSNGQDPINSLHLTTLGLRAEELTRDLPRVRHPNPFGRRAPLPESDTEGAVNTGGATAGRRDTSSAADAESEPIYEGGKGKFVVGALVAAVLGLGVWGMMSHTSHNTTTKIKTTQRPPKKPKHTGTTPSVATSDNTATPTASATAVPPATPTPQQATTGASDILIARQIAVEAIARNSAQQDASDAVRERKHALSEDATDAIVARAITAGYKEALPSDQFAAAYADKSKPWTYARYKSVVPSLTSSVYEAASSGVEEGQEALRLAAIQAGQSVAPTPEPTPHRTRRPDPTPEPTHRPRHVEETPAPPKKHATPRPNAIPATPQAGTAGQTGL